MSLTTYKLTLDVKRDLHQVLVMKENDANSRCVEVTITDNGKLFDIGNNQVSLNWRKPDETFADTTCTKLSPSTVSFVCSRQMLLVPGIAKAELRLSDSSGTLLSTMPFHISIKPAAISNTDLTSSNEFKSLEKLLEDFHKEHEKVKEDVTALKHATENTSKRAQSYSEGGTNSRQGEDTDNAKYYKNMAKSYSSGGTNLRQGEDTDNAKYYKQKALESANAAKLSEHYAEQYSTMSGDHASASEAFFNMAKEKATDAKGYAEDAQNYAKEAKSYTHGGTNSRNGEDTDNSKYYYQQSKSIYDNFSQAGTVTGVKGNAEGSYRAGNVNLTAENIGAYGKLNIGTSGYNYQSNCIVIRGVSLNEIDESGLYFCDAPLDAPVTTNGFMIAITYAGKIRGMQLFMPLGENQIYKRQNTNGTWGSWEKINAGRAEVATVVSSEVATTNVARRIYFANTIATNANAALVYDDDFKYNPVTKTLFVENINVPGIINFINNARLRFIPPDVTSVHAKGIDFMNKAGNGIWGGIGAYGQGGQNTAIYLAADTPGPWEPANGLFITGSSIKWKNSSLVTEDSSIIGNIMDALSALAYDDWEECMMGTGGWTDFNGHCHISIIPKSEVTDGQTFLCKFCGMVCGATAAINSRGEYYFKNVVWYTRKTAGPVRDQITAAAGGFSSGNGPGLPGGAYSSTIGLVVRMSTVNSALKSYYRKV